MHILKILTSLIPPSERSLFLTTRSLKPIDPVVRALKAAGKDNRVTDRVTLTAFEPLQASPLDPGTADVMVFPDNVCVRGVPVESLADFAVATLAAAGPLAAGAPAAAPGAGAWAPLPELTIMVCCHNKRDERCGVLGPQLAQWLAELLRRRGLGAGAASVLQISHIGGHKYAGNVIVYRPGQLGHGDWFGRVHAENAEAWLDALLSLEDDALRSPALRPHWRGRLALSKEEQLELFAATRGECQRHGDQDIEELA